ncbi:MAG: lysine-sensitive aspartokinase 3 [Ignavibacteria bacterium]|nr:lysine-sensitive aspartokinase 3 [Ignavibacteria bacterium]
MIVSKFGGTSVQDSNAINRLYSIVSNRTDETFIVVSALSKVTDNLVQIAHHLENRELQKASELIDSIFNRHFILATDLNILPQIQDFLQQKREELKNLANALLTLGEISPRSLDKILSYGEILSSYLIYLFLQAKGLDIVYYNPVEIIKTDSNFTSAEIDFKETKRTLSNFVRKSKHQLRITGGFVGSTYDGITTTLSRGGSDYTASAIASILNAKALEIWTDVDGILTADPKIVPNAKLIKEISYFEASEMATFGAKVLHPKTIFPAVKSRIPVFVLNSLKPEKAGTLITFKSPRKKIVKAITYRKGITVVTIRSNRMLGAYGYLQKVFEIFGKYKTSVDLVSTSEVSISLTIDDTKDLKNILKELSKIAECDVSHENAMVSVVGEGLKNSTNIANRIFNSLREVKIIMVSMGASDINFSIVVKESSVEKVVNLLHNEFFSKNNYPELFEDLYE